MIDFLEQREQYGQGAGYAELSGDFVEFNLIDSEGGVIHISLFLVGTPGCEETKGRELVAPFGRHREAPG